MKKTSHYQQYEYLYDRLKKQEQAIAQLVEIIGSLNRTVGELKEHHKNMEQPVSSSLNL
ncbi:hypothetical protein LCL89_11470 [Halobacillus yeomjeoni]|uniref:hypothetical protein n=1 Tax=Halobacillus yeomjeoni TaxID=311194 RepID=UPI001CD21BC1|nr:hypothetical protein [Halobacillus yeomjeoni]MCA0984664.1 hypothetical protein [Halobacillus yeomjeoni]